MGRGALELKLKFVGAPHDVAALPRSRTLKALTPATRMSEAGWNRVHINYFDNADGDLATEGISTSQHLKTGFKYQTIKRGTAAGAVVQERFERALGNGAVFPAPCGDQEIDSAIAVAARSGLAQIAETIFDRWTQPAVFEGAEFMIAVNLGRAVDAASGAEAPIAEIVVKHIAGDMTKLFDVARLIVDAAPLRLSVRTRLDAAKHASDGGSYRIGKLEKPLIDPEAPAAEALQTMLAAVACRIVDIQAPLLDIRDPGAVRHMRVALRRFRSVERTFRRAVKTDALYALARRARAIGKALGETRDLDVFLDETAPEAFSRLEKPAGAADLRDRAQGLRAASWAEAYRLIADRSFTHFALDLLEAGVLAPWREDLTKRGRGSLQDFAPEALDKAWARTQKVEAAMDRTLLAARHPLRIALKKQRYAAQMLGPLYPKDIRKPYMAAMSGLQGALGAVNDAVVAQDLAERISAGAGDEARRAAGFIVGYKAAEAEAAAAEIDHAWEKFKNTPPFWRDNTPTENARYTDHPLP